MVTIKYNLSTYKDLRYYVTKTLELMQQNAHCFQHIDDSSNALADVTRFSDHQDDPLTRTRTTLRIDFHVDSKILSHFFQLISSLSNDTSSLALMNQHLRFHVRLSSIRVSSLKTSFKNKFTVLYKILDNASKILLSSFYSSYIYNKTITAYESPECANTKYLIYFIDFKC